MCRVAKFIKFALTYVGVFGIGIYFAAFIFCGLDFIFICGIFTCILLSVCSGLSLYEDIRSDAIDSVEG